MTKSLFQISLKGCSARRKRAKKRSVHAVHEHFEPAFICHGNAAMRPSVRFGIGSKRRAPDCCDIIANLAAPPFVDGWRYKFAEAG